MLTLELLKQFSDDCLNLRRALYSGLPFNEMDALFVRSHVQLLLSDIEKFKSAGDGIPDVHLGRLQDPSKPNSLQS